MTIPARGMGYLPDDDGVVAEELVSKHVSYLVGTTIDRLPPYVDYTQLVAEVDQRSTSSCVGQGFASAVKVTANLAGLSIPRPSSKAIYDFARLADRPFQRTLDDAGCRPLAAIYNMVERGLVAEADWEIVWHADGSSNINTPPPLDVYQEALAARVSDWYRIGAGPGASGAIRQALARGYCPVFVMPVDSAYQWWAGDGVYEGRRGPSEGLHLQATGGYGDGHILVLSSWGFAHGNRGVVKIANDYFDSGECTDIIVCRVVPPLTL